MSVPTGNALCRVALTDNGHVTKTRPTSGCGTDKMTLFSFVLFCFLFLAVQYNTGLVLRRALIGLWVSVLFLYRYIAASSFAVLCGWFALSHS